MRAIRHLTPRYVVNRLKVAFYEKSHPSAPWLTSTAIEILDSWLKPGDRGFEWGSGRSTLWFANRVESLTSVEHDPLWAERVGELLKNGNAGRRVSYRLFTDGSDERPDSAYVRAIDEASDESLDFCLVDGATRDHCAIACIEKLRRGGLLVVDNANWYIPRQHKSCAPSSRGISDGYASSAWDRFGELVAPWRCIWTTNGVTDTAIWFKPPR